MVITVYSSVPSPGSPHLAYSTPGSASVSPQRRTSTKKHAAVKSQLARSILHAKAPRKSRVVFNFTAEEMEPYYHLPQREAAKLLGVAVITIKRMCKRRGIRWPYRDAKLKKIQEARATAAFNRCHQPQLDPLRVSGMTLLSDAVLAFARLPFECMEENATEKVIGV
ncbi:Winged helix-turn-helix dna-binding domain [Globisporangium polare]